jgi:trehalose synthase-fused probable maltokinase
MDHFFSHVPALAGADSATFLSWVAQQRWFGGKARAVSGWEVANYCEAGPAVLLAVRVTYADGSELYAVPVAWCDAEGDAAILQANGRTLVDASALPGFREWLFAALEPTEAARRFFPGGGIPDSRVLKAEQSNTSLVYGERLFVKLYRRLVTGENPDAELTRYLSETARFSHVPRFGGAASWGGAALALATELTPNQGDAWPLALAAAREFYATGNHGDWPARAALLGKRTGEMHTALAAGTGGDFAPEPLTTDDLAELCGEVARLERTNRAAVAGRLDTIPPETAALARSYLSAPADVPSVKMPHGALKTRTHGDYHLGQVLWTGSDFVIIDFEGEPSRTLAERRAKRSSLRDVAGMLRSFHYAAHAAAKTGGDAAEAWAAASQSAFLDAWKDAAPSLTNGLPLLPLFSTEKALYELAYELNNRPDWVGIPLRALV